MKLASVVLTLALAPAAVFAQAGQVVGYNGVPSVGNGTNWQPDQQFGGVAEVTTAKGCGTALVGACSGGFGNVGTGSLALSLQGKDGAWGGTSEWAFYYRWAGGPTAGDRLKSSFGALGSLSALSFDWFRTSEAKWDDEVATKDWPYKTPVIRLRLLEKDGDGTEFESELIWEGWYNTCSLGANTSNCAANKTPVDQWVRQENMQLDRFWYTRPPAATDPEDHTIVAQGVCNITDVNKWDAGLTGSTLDQLLGRSEDGPGCIDSDAKVLGIAVGVGNNWPWKYTAYVDNIRLGFVDERDGYYQALDANFDFVTTVPEPSTWALMGAGLIALGVASRRRNRRSESAE